MWFALDHLLVDVPPKRNVAVSVRSAGNLGLHVFVGLAFGQSARSLALLEGLGFRFRGSSRVLV